MKAAYRASLVVAGLVLLAACASVPKAAKKRGGKGETLPPKQVYELALRKMEKRRYFAARTLLQQVLPRIPPEDRDLLPKVQLALADAFYKDGGIANFGEAQNAYRNFLTYFPQHEKAAYAQYMVGLSMFHQVLAPDRDQTMTIKAIAELEKVETTYPDSPYVSEAHRTIDKCFDQLAEKERLVGHFYQKRKAWRAAIARYRVVLDKYPRYSDTAHLLLDFGECLLKTNERDQAQEAFDRLAQLQDTDHLVKKAREALADYDRRREKEGERFYGALSKEEKSSKP